MPCGAQKRQNPPRDVTESRTNDLGGAFRLNLLADDFKTTNGKEYKNATVNRLEADGIVLKTKLGISKVYLVELPKDVQERFHDAAQLARALDTKTPADLMKQAESALQGNNFA